MDQKENAMMAAVSKRVVYVKPEPNDISILPLSSTTAQQNKPQSQQKIVKQHPAEASVPPRSNIFHQDRLGSTHNVVPKLPHFNTYKSAKDIAYLPETALKEGLGMIKAIKEQVKTLELGSKMRKEVWLREIAGLESQGAPTTLIAVCGATGAGKSSLLNAILNDNIVPTSGMRACTAVVTEIAYHDKPTINAEISFLSLAEWREELEVLLEDMVDEDGTVRRATDLRSEAGIAWHKVHAVYPSIDQDHLARMTVDQIITHDPAVAKYLGTVKHICEKDSKGFINEIAKYIDSKDEKHNKSGRKKGKKDKKNKDKKAGKDTPALWPLIRQVQVKCHSKALSTGAILVDLPGVADANMARSNICKEYIKKCNCVWVLAPITRAVDDRTAKDLLGDAFRIQLRMDGNYDDTSITFVATKADDISCNEVIRALDLSDDPDLQEVEHRISLITNERKVWKKRQATAIKAVKATEALLKDTRATKKEYQDYLAALEEGRSLQPKFSVKKPSSIKKSLSLGKRKRRADKGKLSKRHKTVSRDGDSDETSDSDVDSFIDDDSEEDEIEESDHDNDALDQGSDTSDEDSSDSHSSSSEVDDDDPMGSEEVTKEYCQNKLEEVETLIKTMREKLTEERLAKKKAHDEIINAKSRLAKAQTEKNGICSLKRSEHSRDVLKEDFRAGVREIDDADAQERDPDNFDPSIPIRSYEDIDLPTFCASARDYMRITKQVKEDGDPTCFTRVEDTDIPALQEWCHHLTIASRKRAACNFFSHLKTFINSVRSYVRGITEVKEEDRNALRVQWESPTNENDTENDEDNFDPYAWLRLDAWAEDEPSTTKKKSTGTIRTDIRGRPLGITKRLAHELENIVDDAVTELKNGFEDGLNEKLQAGAANASIAAIETSDCFAASMPWQTYRATLRRLGTFRRCLNTELINPLTRSIASSWARVFEADLFASFEARTMTQISKLLKEIEASAAPTLQDRAKSQAEVALEEAKVAMKALVTVVREIMNEQQKNISRCLIPHLQGQLRSGYVRAMEERGRGSVARQKAVFHNFIDQTRSHIFNGGADSLLEKLGVAADSVGNALDNALGDLAQKIEVSMSVLWESPRDDPRQKRACRNTLETLQTVEEQMLLWTTAAKLHEAATNGCLSV